MTRSVMLPLRRSSTSSTRPCCSRVLTWEFTFCRASPSWAASVVAVCGWASAASIRARIGSSETSAAAASSITATSCMLDTLSPTILFVKEEKVVRWRSFHCARRGYARQLPEAPGGGAGQGLRGGPVDPGSWRRGRSSCFSPVSRSVTGPARLLGRLRPRSPRPGAGSRPPLGLMTYGRGLASSGLLVNAGRLPASPVSQTTPLRGLVLHGLLDQGPAEVPHQAAALAGVLHDLGERLGEQLDLGVADHQRRDELDDFLVVTRA